MAADANFEQSKLVPPVTADQVEVAGSYWNRTRAGSTSVGVARAIAKLPAHLMSTKPLPSTIAEATDELALKAASRVFSSTGHPDAGAVDAGVDGVDVGPSDVVFFDDVHPDIVTAASAQMAPAAAYRERLLIVMAGNVSITFRRPRRGSWALASFTATAQ